MDLLPIKSLVGGLPLAAMVVDQNRKLVYLNEPACEIWGKGLEGRHYEIALRNPVLTGAIADCFREPRTFHSRLTTAVGTRDATFALRVSPITGEEFQGVLATFEDVSPLEDIGQMRRDFVANVSHELRTPLTALLGFIETLRGPAKDDARARDRFLTIMETEATRMNRLVHDLLSLSRVESEERIRPGQQLDVTAKVASVVRALGPIAEDKGIAVRLSMPEEPIMVSGDADQLYQVFTNLIENAIKYGSSGGDVEVTVTRLERDPMVRGPAVRIDVRDHGQGIDPIHIPRLTERFYRVDSHRSREMGGTGLGLAIVKHIVNRHRGRMKIESALGQGSTFTVTLPRS